MIWFRSNPLPFIFSILCLIGLFGCSKTNESGTSLVYNKWTYTGSAGSISVNGNPLGASTSSNSNGNITVSFQSGGNYNFIQSPLTSETDGFSLVDSTIILHNDSSWLANFCAYPVVYFGTYPNLPVIIPQHVSPNLLIQYISRDSLLVKTEFTKPGVGAPDTLYTEYTGFRK